MPMKQTGRKVYKSMQGKTVDMDLLRQRNELTQAVGNAKVNARGDELGPGGKIIKKREEVLADYYQENALPEELAVKKTDTNAPVEKDLTDDWVEPEVTTEDTDNWVEDEDGNFVKKGD